MLVGAGSPSAVLDSKLDHDLIATARTVRNRLSGSSVDDLQWCAAQARSVPVMVGAIAMEGDTQLDNGA